METLLYQITITTSNTINLRQYKSRLSLTIEQTLAFASSTNLVREVVGFLQISKELHKDVLRYR